MRILPEQDDHSDDSEDDVTSRLTRFKITRSILISRRFDNGDFSNRVTGSDLGRMERVWEMTGNREGNSVGEDTVAKRLLMMKILFVGSGEEQPGGSTAKKPWRPVARLS